MPPVRTDPPAKVRIGGLSRSELLAALRERHVQLNPAAEALFADSRFETLERPHVVEIALRSVAELGFPGGATYPQLIDRARESELVECPLELGPHLRMRFEHQPAASETGPPTRGQAPPGSITIASPPLDERDETPKGFYLRRRDGQLWLRGYRSSNEHVWNPGDVLVFSKSTTPESNPS